MKTFFLIVAMLLGSAFASDGWKIKQEFSAPGNGVLVRCANPMSERDQKRTLAVLESVKTWAAKYAKKENLKVVTDKMPERIVFTDEPVGYRGAISMEPMSGCCEPARDRILVNYNDNIGTLLHEFAHWFFGEQVSDLDSHKHRLCNEFRDYCWPLWKKKLE